jgi:hypothetical protein
MKKTPVNTRSPAVLSVSATGYRILPVAGTQMYSALLADNRNRIYMATCDLRRPAYLIRLTPDTGKIERLGHMQAVTGECDPEQIPQSKIHSQLIMDNGGRIWFGTHNEEMYNSAFGSLEVYPKGYPGGHLVNFNPKTSAFTDFGIPFPQKTKTPTTYRDCGLYFLSMTRDPQNDILYALLGDKIHIAAFDMSNGKLLDCQPAPLPYPYADHLEPRGPGFQQCRDLRVGADGNVYTFTHSGQLMRYSPAGKRIELLDIWVPGGTRSLKNHPYAMVTNPEHTRIYGNGSLGGNIFELAIEPGKEPVIRDFGIPYRLPPEENTIHGITMGLDGLLYFIGSSRSNATFYSLNPETGKIHFFGPVVFTNLNGAHPRKSWAACTAADGTLWYGGDIYPAKPGEFAPSLSYFSIDPKTLSIQGG